MEKIQINKKLKSFLFVLSLTIGLRLEKTKQKKEHWHCYKSNFVREQQAKYKMPKSNNFVSFVNPVLLLI